jgi:phosphopantothenoylcysteine decarboxylase/phosphopantothenate--cysteine ligase
VPVGRRPRVVLGVCGGIAAYKAAEVLRGLTESGMDVTVVPTQASLRFVGEATWAALSGRPVATSVWDQAQDVPHVRLGQQADLVLVVPATADLLARACGGIAHDLLTNVLLTARCPVLMAPAMHTEMWQHPATRFNVEVLRSRGVRVLDPASGRLTGSDSGPGRLPDPLEVVAAASDLLRRTPSADLSGLRIAISAGGTREAWDPVRYLGNRSSGRQGIALARTAISRGAQVTLVAGSMDAPAPAGVRLVQVESAADLHESMLALIEDCEVVVMAAAVADFRPAQPSETKVKKDDTGAELAIHLIQTTDVLADLCRRRKGRYPTIVGFAAETAPSQQALIELGRSKLARKGCDLLVVNEVGSGDVFGTDSNAVTILGSDGTMTTVARTSKDAVADAVWDAVAERLGRAQSIDS